MFHTIIRQSPTVPPGVTKEDTSQRSKNGIKWPINWTGPQKVVFRFAFIYFTIQSVPLDPKYYGQLLSIDFSSLYYGDIFSIARYYPRFVSGGDTFVNWAVAAMIAFTGAMIWTVVEKRSVNYDRLYYWLRVIVRYRLAIAVIAYGFIKFFPIQAPFPTLSSLNTRYGDFSHWKVLSVSLGAAPLYERFLGVVEILAGVLLFRRTTATIGAFLIIAFVGNVFLSNLAYEGGEHIYSLHLVLLALFLVIYDARRIWNAISEHKPTSPNTWRPTYGLLWQKRLQILVKSSFIIFFVIIYGSLTYAGYHRNPHTLPVTAGLPESSGIYNVKEFRLNGKILQYSAVDPFRWQDVVFEKWATVSIRSNRPVIVDSLTTEIISPRDHEKPYEHSGIAARHFYSYAVDSVRQLLMLKNKNSHYPNEYLQFKYSRPDTNTILLSGFNQDRQPVDIRLERINKRYLFPIGRNKPITL